ncbi:hypothetical protein CMO93_03950 [Candidatus Woesearchaeota archaeon]|nr:hypothetical protein [Candidatus Woesearchaeota archaeon]|tara:strand:+ start:47449 stop:47871 length:423 start_codon:yes stop_codon:yes gene_type:complete
MTIVSFNFTKIEAEKKDPAKGKININNNVTIENVEEKDLSLGNQKQKVLNFTFEFTSKYDPDAGNIKLIGSVLYMEDAKKVKEILDGWKKDKKLPKDIMTRILNVVLNKSNVQALILSEQVGLPPPIPLPKVQAEQKTTS